MLNNVRALHNKVCTFGSEPCKPFRLPLHAVFHKVFVNSVVALACWTSLYGHASLGTQRCACPLPDSTQTLLHSALCFKDYCQHFVRDGVNKEFFGVNEGKLTIISFPKEARTGQKLKRSCFLANKMKIPVCGFIHGTSST